MNPRLRTLAVIAVGVALLLETWLWIGVLDARSGMPSTVESPCRPPNSFSVDARHAWSSGNMTIRAGPYHFEQDWPLSDGGAVHVSEDLAPYSILFSAQSSYEELIAAIHTRSKWHEGTALGGRVNALNATIGRVSISIEGPLSHDDLFRIAESLRPGFAPLLGL